MDQTQLILKILEIIVEPLFFVILGMALMVFFLKDRSVRKIELISKFFHFRSEKFRDLIKNDYNVTKLEITDDLGKPISKPYILKHGIHKFRCVATYTDGSKEAFSPYWLCWERGNPRGTDVLGRFKEEVVQISYSERHAKYTELSCWVFAPKKEESNSHIPFDSTGFKYE